MYRDTRKSENAREAIKMPLKTQIQRMAHILRFSCRIYTFYFFRVFLCRKEETCNRTALKAKCFSRSHPSRRHLAFYCRLILSYEETTQAYAAAFIYKLRACTLFPEVQKSFGLSEKYGIPVPSPRRVWIMLNSFY